MPPTILDSNTEKRTLGNILPNEHDKLIAEHGGIWDYRITAPISLDSPAEIRIHVVYGMKGRAAVTSRIYVIHLEPK